MASTIDRSKLRANVTSKLAKVKAPQVVVKNELEEVSIKVELVEGEKMFSDLFYKPTLGDDFPVKVLDKTTDDWWNQDLWQPVENPDYVWPKPETELFLRAMKNGDKSYLVGPPGCGKSDMVQQVAFMTCRPWLRFNFNSETNPAETFGSTQIRPEDGVMTTKFVETDIPHALTGPFILLLDELPFAQSSIVSTFQRMFESNDGHLYIPEKTENKIIKPHPDFIPVVASNVKGLGDNMDKYASNNVLDISTIDRFETFIEFSYLPMDDEIKLLMSMVLELPHETAKNIVKFANLIRDLFTNNKVSLPLSPRALKPIAKYSIEFKNPLKAIKFCYLAKLAEDQQISAVRESARTVFDNYNELGGL